VLLFYNIIKFLNLNALKPALKKSVQKCVFVLETTVKNVNFLLLACGRLHFLGPKIKWIYIKWFYSLFWLLCELKGPKVAWSCAFCFFSRELVAYYWSFIHTHKLAAFWAGSPVVGNWLCPLCKAAAAERRSVGRSADREKANKFPLVFSNLFHVLTIWPRGRRTIKQCSSARRQTSIVVRTSCSQEGNQQILLKRSALCTPAGCYIWISTERQ